MATSNIAPPNESIPASKASDKQNLFRSFKYIVANALAYTANYRDDPEERDFIDYLDDVVKTLPSNEQTVPVCALLLFTNMVRRSETNPLRVVELVDASRPAPKPVQMHNPDGTFTTIEQVKSSKPQAKLTPGTAFEFKGNTAAFLPVATPITLTFTPDVTKFKSGGVVAAMSYDVLANGTIHERDVPLRFPPSDVHDNTDRGTPHAASSIPAEPQPTAASTRPAGDSSTEQTPAVAEPSKAATSTEVEESTSKAILRLKKSNASKTKTADAGKLLPSAPATATAGIPFPSMSSTPEGVIAANGSQTNASRKDKSPLSREPEEYLFAVNHFPPHPHAADGRPPVPGRRIALQRSYAFTHKSHPEIFWDSAWGEKPSEGQTRPVENHSQPLPGKNKGKGRSDNPSERDRPLSAKSNSPTRVPSSGSAMRAMMQFVSVKQGKKRAREEGPGDVDVDGERPSQRRRAGMSDGADIPRRFSRRLSGLKKAVMDICS